MGENLRKRPHPDSEPYKVQAELNSISERLAAALKEKQQTEKSYQELLVKKDNLILELHRKLEEQRVKATSENKAMKTNLEELQLRFNQIESEKQALSEENRELISDLETALHEAAELRFKCKVLAKNDNVSETVANTSEEFCSTSSQANNDQLKPAKVDDGEQIDDELLKASYPYVISDKKKRAQAEKVEERRKSVVYWGVATDPRSRWNLHKSRNAFTDESHEMLILRKWTDDNLPKDVYTHRSAALVDEHVLGGFCRQFTPITKAKSGNGNLEEASNKKLAKEQWRINELSIVLDDILLNGKMEFEPWKCPHCSVTNANVSALRIHINDNHLTADAPNKKTYKCTHADCVDLAPFRMHIDLQKHNQDEHNKPPSCIECNVTLAKKSDLKNHLINWYAYEKMYAKQAAGCKMTKVELKQLNQNKFILACILRLLSMGRGIGKAQTYSDQQVFDICERVSKELKFESCPPEAIEIGLKMLKEQSALKIKKGQIRVVGDLEEKRLLLIVDTDLIEKVQKLDLQ